MHGHCLTVPVPPEFRPAEVDDDDDDNGHTMNALSLMAIAILILEHFRMLTDHSSLLLLRTTLTFKHHFTCNLKLSPPLV